MQDLIKSIMLKNSVPIMPNGAENLTICEVCGEQTRAIMDFKKFGGKRLVNIPCKCERDAEELKKQTRIKAEKLEKMQRLRKLSLLGERYENVRFNNTKAGLNPTFDAAFSRCQKYCEVHKEIYKKGLGIYLFGHKGTGKTHLTACIANELLQDCVPVLLTNLFEISKAVKSTYKRSSTETEQRFFNRFESVDFLVIDDLGTEIFSKNDDDTWMQTLLFDLVNQRYNSGKPTIFSSNYSLDELINLRGISEKTVDRIAGMTKGAAMKIEGKSWRNKNHGDSMPF